MDNNMGNAGVTSNGENMDQGGNFTGNNQNAGQDPNCGYGNQGQGAGQYQNYGYENPGNGYGQPGGYPYLPQGGYQQELEEPMSMGEWVVTLLLILLVPCVNIVLLFVWAFSKTEKKSKSNFCKAYLIIAGILMVVYAILFIIIFTATAAAL